MLEAEGSEKAAESLPEINSEKAAEILEELGSDYSLDVIGRMDPDDAVDIIAHLDHSIAISLLSKLEEKKSRKIIDLLKYPPTTAGGIMTTDFISMDKGSTVGEAVDTATESQRDVETIYYIYITGEDSQLEGTVALRELLMLERNKKLSEVMEEEVEVLFSDMDREEVARIFDSQNYQAMPVVEEGEIVGIITFDDIIDVMREESTEDIQKMAGLVDNETIFSSWRTKINMRLPWLYLNLIAAFFAAGVVSYFEGTLAQVTILAAFLPVINNQAGNTGMQALSVVIRGQATGDLRSYSLIKYIIKETAVGLLNGFLIGAAVGFITMLWRADIILGAIVAFSMAITVFVSTLAGVLVPITMEKLDYDPATASSIFVTAIADISGIVFLLGTAAVYIAYI